MNIDLLDVGIAAYGDSILCRFDQTTVMIDGAHPGMQVGSGVHPSIPNQLGQLMGAGPPFQLDLLVVSHAHLDHIGCLPNLVTNKVIRPTWALVADPDLGWGILPGDQPRPDSSADSMVTGLREEPIDASADDQTLTTLFSDSLTLEQQYRKMLDDLAAAGTNVVRYGSDDTALLLQAFELIGLSILGPSTTQLQLCATAIANGTTTITDALEPMVAMDAMALDASLYRRIVGQANAADAVRDAEDALADAADASRNVGAAINLQSMVLLSQTDSGRFLFGGDMQFAVPGVSVPGLAEEVKALRAEIATHAPFDFAKLSHHGSRNAFDAEVMDEWKGTKYFGICAGEHTVADPDPTVLTLLDEQRDSITWARTDHNGLSTFTFDANGGPVDVAVARGTTNDAKSNRVADAQDPPVPPAPPSPAPAGEMVLAGGRPLPNLLFLTSAEALAANIGDDAATKALAAIRADAALYDALPPPVNGATDMEQVKAALASHPDIEGVVILGGYDVVAARKIDCLPASVRSSIDARADDPDHFVVWTDDPFGDINADMFPELPVSRVPDGHSAKLFTSALSVDNVRRIEPRKGVANRLRPFTTDIFALLPGQSALLPSRPAVFDQVPPLELDGDLVYLMLHGSWNDATHFAGEEPVYPVAVTIANIPARGGRVVFAGCCWGALPVTEPASVAASGSVPPFRTPADSMAMTFIEAGATAFVGTTGSHYSPPDPPYDFFGGPMHHSFWTQVVAGSQPAKALFEAKSEYLAKFPHGQSDPSRIALEYKTLRQFTCLGLGW